VHTGEEEEEETGDIVATIDDTTYAVTIYLTNTRQPVIVVCREPHKMSVSP